LDIEAHQKDFEWAKVPVGQLKYVHTTEAKPQLFVVMKRKGADERLHHLVVRLNLDLIRGRWLDNQLRELGDSFRLALTDERGVAVVDGVFGGSAPLHRERLLSDAPF